MSSSLLFQSICIKGIIGTRPGRERYLVQIKIIFPISETLQGKTNQRGGKKVFFDNKKTFFFL
jgi:hypothetical protein